MIEIRKTNLECPLESINRVRTRSGPDMVAGGFQRLIEGGFELTVGP